jgi:hypothetical protein
MVDYRFFSSFISMCGCVQKYRVTFQLKKQGISTDCIEYVGHDITPDVVTVQLNQVRSDQRQFFLPLVCSSFFFIGLL